MVRSFMQFRPEMLMKFDSSSSSNAFPSPRSWEFVSRIMHKFPDNGARVEVIKGTVGEGPAHEFCGFVQNHGKLPDIDKLLANPNKKDMPEDNALRYALVGALSDRAARGLSKPGKEKLADALFTISDMMQKEFSILLLRDVLSYDRSLCIHPKVQGWIKTHKKLLTLKAS
jgi:hypothetical protein